MSVKLMNLLHYSAYSTLATTTCPVDDIGVVVADVTYRITTPLFSALRLAVHQPSEHTQHVRQSTSQDRSLHISFM